MIVTSLRADTMAYEQGDRWVCHVYDSGNRDFAEVYADSEERALALAHQLARRMGGTETHTVNIQPTVEHGADNKFIASIYHGADRHHGVARTAALALLRAAAHWEARQ